MPEWLVERGIGETRAALIDRGAIIESRIELEGSNPGGTVIGARLTSIGSNGRNAVATEDDGTAYLLPRGAPGISQGAALNIEVTREAIPGSEPWKRPLARVTDEPPHAPPPLVQRLDGRELSFPSPADELALAGWDDVIEQARSGIVRFVGGELRISPTPAMTLIDIDGSVDPDDLALAGAAEAARTIRWLDIGGSIGIDLPTSRSKAARLKAAEAIDSHLPPPFERTAVNGFGFVQIVRPRRRASLIELAQDRAAFEARALLRRSALEPPGAKRLVAHPAVIAALRSGWIEALARQLGGPIALRANAALPMSGGYAEKG